METNTQIDTGTDTGTGSDSYTDTGTDSSTSGYIHSPMIPEGGEFVPYDTAIELAKKDGLRAVKCLYKTAKGTEKKNTLVNSYVYVPATIDKDSIANNLPQLMPYFITYLQEQENQIVKDLHKLKVSRVFASNVGMNKVLERLEASQLGSRLNKEMIGAWFVESLESKLTEAFAAKMQIDLNEAGIAELEKLELILGTYKARFSSLAGGKVSLKETECSSLQRAISLAGAIETPIGARFYARLESMKKVQEAELFAL